MRKIVMGAVMVAAMGLTTACEPACSGLSASEQDKQAAANGYEVEKTDSMGNECQLSGDGSSWSVDD